MALTRQGADKSDGISNPLSTVEGKSLICLDDVIRLFNNAAELTYDPENKDNLACPFWKHNPTRYRRVNNACTTGVGFKDLGKLTEHIRRVHCLRFGCEKCRVRFNRCKIEDIDEEKRKHVAKCTKLEVELPDSEPEWMDESQDGQYRRLNFMRDKGKPVQCYEKICCALWGTDFKNPIPGPYHLPGFQVTVLRLGFATGLKQLNVQKKSEEAYQTRQGIATATPALVVQHIDPMLLSQQALRDLSTGPEPFFRGKHRKDSGVWSWDHSSENQPGVSKHPLDLPYDTEDMEEDDEISEQLDSDYNKTGAWTNATVPDGTLNSELDEM